MNNEMKNDRGVLSPSEILQLFVVTIFFVFVFGAIAMLVGGKTFGLLSESLIIMPALFLVWRQKRPFASTFRLRSINASLLLHSFIISFVIFVIGDEIDRIISSRFPMPEIWMNAMEKILRIHSVQDALLLFLTAVLFAGFAEEMLFRGMLQKSLEVYWRPLYAILLTSVIFAVLHFNPWTVAQISLLGLVLGYLAWKSQSIFPGIVLHASNNMFSIILMNLPEPYLRHYATENHVKIIWIAAALIMAVPAFVSYHRECEQQVPPFQG